MDPSLIVLPSNRPPDRFYRGGRRITDLRGDPPAGPNEPEDWIASTTRIFGTADAGPTVLPDGTPFADAVARDPDAWFGPAHVAAFGPDPMLLTKLLDAGQRLPVHAHPDGAFAAAHLGHAHGKTEAWVILEAGTVHLGLRRDVTAGELRDLVDRQETAALLELLNEIEVEPGDGVLVPAGQLHAIGEGVLLLEVQEPEDLSVLLEWRGFALDGARNGHLGLGFDVALEAVAAGRLDAAALDQLVMRTRGTGSVLPSTADPFFGVERVVANGPEQTLQGYAVLLVAAGSVEVGGIRLRTGSTAALPHGAGPLPVAGDGELLVCRPPRTLIR